MLCQPVLSVRPYQLLCLFCRKGACGTSAPYYHPEALDRLEQALRDDPAVPLALHCNCDSVYRFQNPGRELDTPEGAEYNDLRDLTVLCKLDLCPGDTRPAIDIIEKLTANITSTRDICAYPGSESAGWPACRLAESGNFERGLAEGASALLTYREESEKLSVKRSTAAECAGTRPLRIRPHHLICMACFHGGKSDEALAPIDEDNLEECIRAIQRDPQIPIEMVVGTCMICPPCKRYQNGTGLCIGGRSMGLRDQKKDLDTLRLLGASYGDVRPAAELLSRLFAVLTSTTQVCGHNDGMVRSRMWWGCGAEGNAAYEAGREACMGVAI